MQPKILVVYYRHKPGGFSHRLQMKIEAYLAEGWQVHYVAVEQFPYDYPALVSHILPTPMKRFDTPGFWVWFFLTAPWYVLGVGLKVRPRLISVFSPPYAWVCGLLKTVKRIPLVMFLRTRPNEAMYSYRGAGWANRIEALLDAWGLRFCDLIIANSETVLAETRQGHPTLTAQVVVLPNHLPEISVNRPVQRAALLREFSLAEEAFVLVTTGRLHRGKNLDLLIDALAEISDPRAVLVVFGEGDQLDDLKAQAARRNLMNRVLFAGWREDVRQLLPGADLFILPSLKEGMSNSLIEAMACGLPCLVSAIPENCEVITRPDQRFSPEQPEALAELLRRCLGDPEFYQSICEQTQKDADRFRFDWKQRVVALVRPLMEKTGPDQTRSRFT